MLLFLSFSLVFGSGYVLQIETCSSSVHTNSGSAYNTAYTFTSSDGNVVSEQFLIAPTSHSTLYTVGNNSAISSVNWTSLAITTSISSDNLCVDHIVVDGEVWVGTTWLDKPCSTSDYSGYWQCETTFTWYRNNFEVQIHTCDVSNSGAKTII
jgi:hypothetical protein